MYSQALKIFVLDVVLKSALVGAFGGVMGIPVVGSLINWVAKILVGYLLDKGIIEFKEVLIDVLSEKAKRDYAPQIAILREAQHRPSMTPEEEAEYEKRLQEIVRNHPSVVNG